MKFKNKCSIIEAFPVFTACGHKRNHIKLRHGNGVKPMRKYMIREILKRLEAATDRQLKNIFVFAVNYVKKEDPAPVGSGTSDLPAAECEPK